MLLFLLHYLGIELFLKPVEDYGAVGLVVSFELCYGVAELRLNEAETVIKPRFDEVQKFLVTHFWAFHDIFLLEQIFKSSRTKIQHTYQLHSILILHLPQYLLYLFFIKPIVNNSNSELSLVNNLKLRPLIQIILRDEV